MNYLNKMIKTLFAQWGGLDLKQSTTVLQFLEDLYDDIIHKNVGLTDPLFSVSRLNSWLTLFFLVYLISQ